MIPSFMNRGALSLVAISLLAGSAAAEVFEKLSAVPQGRFLIVLSRDDS
jgi:tripeptidyl-peptidase-1